MDLSVHQKNERKMLVTLHNRNEHLLLSKVAEPVSAIGNIKDELLFRKVHGGIINGQEVSYPYDIYVSEKQVRTLGKKLLNSLEAPRYKNTTSEEYIRQIGAPLIHWYMKSINGGE